MLKRFDEKLVEGKHQNFQDKGVVSKGATTHKFAVTSRYNQSLLGYVRFYAQWRQYVFYPLNCILNEACMRETADFCREATTAQREKRKSFPVPESEPVVEAGMAE